MVLWITRREAIQCRLSFNARDRSPSGRKRKRKRPKKKVGS